MVINGLALLVSACVGLAPVGIFLFMPETEADAATKKKAEKKSDDGEDEESEDEAEGAEIDDFDADDETEGAFAAVDSPDSEAESDFDISDTGYDTMTAPPTEPDLFVEGDDADFEDFGTEEIDKDA